MRKEKRARLERTGWAVGSARDFLGMTEAEEALVELKLALSRMVRKRRTRGRMTQEELAKLLGSSQSRVAKMEAGDASVTIDLLIRSLLAMGVPQKGLARAICHPTK